ncbi:glycosyltransferase [Commensalibacter nepenthis]|uniref:Uncharacterized protein n=1 Tax=Commensalibacter nepenthis TaxID=3043872 RepID=A0ABT6Q8S0_9PROT|nr:glycosyltransferase [Commensalibacter sp. TBRC 10068]MDI2113297.1 hypothetical protein [Commensalibacter sp. TBRC 10068]
MQHKQKWFDHILNSQWVILGSNEVIQPQRDSSKGIWLLGNITVDDQEILEAYPNTDIHGIKEFNIIHDSWKVASFKLYRPLIYFCAFGKSEIFECVYTAIQSLIEFGKWKHDIVIFTATETKEFLENKLLDLELKNKLHIITITPATDTLDWVMARYRINHPILQQAQPILYLDTDIVCNAPLDTLFIDNIDSSLILACKEGRIDEGHPESGGYWYGWRLMKEDNVPFNPYGRGFSAGAMFFRNLELALPLFNIIIKSVYGFMKQQGYNDDFYDQRFTNYILFKLKKIDIEILANWLLLHRIAPGTHSLPTQNKKLGLVHFLNVSTKDKLITMKKYLDTIRPENAILETSHFMKHLIK